MNFDKPELILIPFIIGAAILLTIACMRAKIRRQNAASLEQTLRDAGYAYDPKQDIFYSRLDAWQRNFGYSRLYDEAAAPMSMIIDCEPVQFRYDGRDWLIELWKGQYGMTTGCEIGVYTRDGPTASSPGILSDVFYKCAEEKDQLQLAFALKKGGRTLFAREGRHWWLTGFLLGEFSETRELSMDVRITLQNQEMRDSFVFELAQMGYSNRELRVIGNTVWLRYDQPRSPQPLSRTQVVERFTQKKNKLLCRQYQELTKGCRTAPEKIVALRERAPELYRLAIRLGRTMQLFKAIDLMNSPPPRG